jgi:hypothetical protein
MENLKQGVTLIVLRKELHKYPEVSGKKSELQRILLFWKNIQPMK